MKLAPSNNPEAESKKFATIALVGGIMSLVVWLTSIVAIAFGVRALILSVRVRNHKYIAFSIIAIVLGLFTIIYYYTTK